MLLKRRNKTLALRCLLLTGYLFLFAAQINCRYYSIANFYVYGNNRLVTSKVKADKLHPVTILRSTQRPNHLGIDKRFYYVDVIKPSTVFFQSVLFSTIIERKYGKLQQSYSSSGPPVISLRGPPAA